MHNEQADISFDPLHSYFSYCSLFYHTCLLIASQTQGTDTQLLRTLTLSTKQTDNLTK